jgi:Carbohydrate-binding family 9
MKTAYMGLFMVVGLVLAGGGGCASMSQQKQVEKEGTYHVARLQAVMAIDAKWDKPAWSKIHPIELTHYMGDKPEHFPRVQAKLAYDDQALYAIYRVEDRYVRAVANHHQDPVCRDSCVEFFFTPGTDTAAGYFNLEMNCGGIMLFNFQLIPWKNQITLKEDDVQRVQVAHSLPRNVEPEIASPTTWTVEYRVPTDLFAQYCPSARKPAPGVTWRANVYKCGDATSHPHWLTWAVVQDTKPNFHLPQYFGTLVFE